MTIGQHHNTFSQAQTLLVETKRIELFTRILQRYVATLGTCVPVKYYMSNLLLFDTVFTQRKIIELLRLIIFICELELTIDSCFILIE